MTIRLDPDVAARISAKNRAARNPHGPSAAKGNPLSTSAPLPRADGDLTLELPYPPTVNTYWRNLPSGRTVLSKRAREYRIAVLAAVGPSIPLLGRLSAFITIYPPDKRKRDLDNIVKAIFDSLAHANVYQDDSQIDAFTVVRGAIVAGGSCTVSIREI